MEQGQNKCLDFETLYLCVYAWADHKNLQVADKLNLVSKEEIKTIFGFFVIF